MSIDRRHFISGIGVLGLAACGVSVPTAQPVRAQSLPDDLRPIRTDAFSAWVRAFRPRALGNGISGSTFDAAFADAGYIPGVVARDGNQIQTRRTLEEYLSIATSDERLEKGRAAIARYGNTLNAIERRYGVPALIVAAIWGMESTFGEKRGLIPVVSSTATLAFDGRRGAFYESQLIAALKILERGDTTPAQLTGSWAGAMGHTQFIPTSYQSFAVDFNDDGRRDIWSDDPADALASTASYLSRNGWRSGVPWGAEAGTSNLSGNTIQPQAGGVRFTVTRNFNVLKTYNNSDLYALGVGHLSDRLGGAGPLQGSFPPDANGLTAADRIALQTRLTARGYDIGTIDGVIGARTEAAISDFQQRQGLTVTGQATRDVLNALR
ncbi:lytic murein transglycosylase [Octadecabacter sp. CECT 8868]|uniref:lytic murein transglycosylase n=1 Tax=Octadecabacter algicola TaxID=2909342 RepID=UPI001F41FA20|nr:lytic murein transglycosylase [Octadecabacter algicola]MCF2904689.1 lytic murein transglycosylase [Octadecabacter algicola]